MVNKSVAVWMMCLSLLLAACSADDSNNVADSQQSLDTEKQQSMNKPIPTPQSDNNSAEDSEQVNVGEQNSSEEEYDAHAGHDHGQHAEHDHGQQQDTIMGSM